MPRQIELPFPAPPVRSARETPHAIALGDRIVPYLLRRSRRRSIGLSIDERGLRVGAPVRATLGEIENLIRCQSASASCRPNNTDADIHGMELALGLMTGPVRHDLSFDITRAEDKNDADRQLLRRARNKGSWLASVTTGPVEWSGEALYVGKRYDNDFSSWPATRRELGSYTLFNLGAHYAVNERLTLGGRVDHLLDRDYDEAVGYPGAGIEFRVTADYRL